MALVELDGVTLDYGALRAVDHVSLTLQEGEICGLVGPNGSGKSSLLNAISGIAPIADGRIAIGGDDLSRAPAHELSRRGVARTFQLVRLLRGRTVRENVASGCYAFARRAGSGRLLASAFRPGGLERAVDERVERALERAGILEQAANFVDELPFGIQRRVELARAIVSEPRLLLFDEPAAGLSERDLEDLEAMIKQEAARGCAVILVDHHLHFVLQVCPRVAVLNFGHAIYDGVGSGVVEDQGVREAYVGT